MKNLLGLDPHDTTQASREGLTAASMGFAYTYALATCIKIDLCGHLRTAPLSVEQLARRCHAKPAPLRELLAILAELRVVAIAGATVTLTATGRLLLADEPHSVRDWILYAADFCAPAWASLPSAIKGGIPSPPPPTHIYAALEADAYDASTFHRAMNDAQDEVADAIVGKLSLRAGDCIADLGCGRTTVLARLLQMHPGTRGIAFDRFADLDAVQASVAAIDKALAGRLTCIRGDFLAPLPFRADVILVKNVLADWSDAHVQQILRNAAAALNPGGRVLVATTYKKPAPTAAQAIVSLNLRVLTEGGDRTLAEYKHLAKAVGLRQASSVATTRAVQLLEFRPSAEGAKD